MRYPRQVWLDSMPWSELVGCRRQASEAQERRGQGKGCEAWRHFRFDRTNTSNWDKSLHQSGLPANALPRRGARRFDLQQRLEVEGDGMNRSTLVRRYAAFATAATGVNLLAQAAVFGLYPGAHALFVALLLGT